MSEDNRVRKSENGIEVHQMGWHKGSEFAYPVSFSIPNIVIINTPDLINANDLVAVGLIKKVWEYMKEIRNDRK
jgi:hypothetical protein